MSEVLQEIGKEFLIYQNSPIAVDFPRRKGDLGRGGTRRQKEPLSMRKILIFGLVVLVVLIGGIIVFSMLSGQHELALVSLPLLPVFFLILCVYLVTAAIAARKARVEGMAIAAEQMAGEFSLQPSGQLEREFAVCSLAQFPGVKLENVITGTVNGTAVRVFEYVRSVDAAKKASAIRYTVLLMPDACPDAPSFRLSPISVWHKVHKMGGAEYVSFEGSITGARFSRSYALQPRDGADIRQIRHFFTEEIVAFFAEHAGWSVEVAGGSLVIWRRDSIARDLARAMRSMRSWIPEDVEQLLQQAMAVKSTLAGNFTFGLGQQQF